MPRLPDWTAVPGPNLKESNRPVASIATNAYGAGIEALGNSLSRGAANLASIAESEKAVEDKVSTANADSFLFRRNDEFRNNMRDNPEKYANWDKEYKTFSTTAMNEAAALIKDERQRQLWIANRSRNVDRWHQTVRDEAWKRGRDEYITFTNDQIEYARNKALDRATPAEDKQEYINNAKAQIDSLYQRGYINESVAEKYKKDWLNGYALKWHEMKSPAERISALTGADGFDPQRLRRAIVSVEHPGSIQARSGVNVESLQDQVKSRVSSLQKQATEAGVPFVVTSGHRDHKHNDRVGGEKGSQHLTGNAVDIKLPDDPEQARKLVSLIAASGVPGMGYYPNSNSIHIDYRNSGPATWGQNRRATSVGQGGDPEIWKMIQERKVVPVAEAGEPTAKTSGGYDGYKKLGKVIQEGPMKGQRAYGLYQVMESNIPVWTKQALGRSLTPQEFLNDSKAQDDVFDFKMAEYVKKYGSIEDAASVWFSGRPASGNNARDSVTGMRVPEYVARVMKVYTGSGGGKLNPVSSMLDPAMREKLLTGARREMRGLAVAERAEVNRQATDASAAYLSGIVDVPNAPTRERYIEAFGLEEGERRFQRQEGNRIVGQNIANFHSMPTGDILQTVNAAKPTEAVEGFADRQKQYNVLAAAANRVIQERNRDPGSYAVTHSDVVKQALQPLLGPNAAPSDFSNFVSVMQAEQQRLGLSTGAILPKAFAQSMASGISNAQSAGDYQRAALEIQKLSQQWGEHWPKVFGQIAKEGGLSGPLLVIGTMNRPDQIDAARRLGEAIANQSEWGKIIDAEEKRSADKSVVSTMDPFSKTLRLPNSSGTVQAFQKSIQLLSYQYIRDGVSGERAVKKAYDEIIGKKYSVMNKDYRIPNDVPDAQKIVSNLEYLKSVTEEFKIDVLSSLTSGMRDKDKLAAQVSNIKAFGRWHTLGDESGVVLMYGNGMPVMSGGAPLTMTWDQIAEIEPILKRAAPKLFRPMVAPLRQPNIGAQSP